MGTFSLWHWLLVLAIILIVFGAGKLPRVMGDFAKGIKAFRSGMKDEADKVEEQGKPADMTPGAAQAAKPAEAQRKEEKV
ncbi:MAG: twin-arginine translocase TatA/TatE family subunit [Alphaproteobacteria bacterium]|nr:twin-arginine translocase TatA/TatE family subunit [Alphaproteobacteria bacterium]